MEYYLEKTEVENEILLRKLKGHHPNVLESYLRCRKSEQREAARKMRLWPRPERNSKKHKRGEVHEMEKRAVEAQMEAMKAIVGELPTDLAREIDEAARHAQAQKKGKRFGES